MKYLQEINSGFFIRLFPWNLPPLNSNAVSKWKDTKENKVYGIYPFYANSNYYLQTKGWPIQ